MIIKEIIATILLFIIIYLIIFIDNKINNKCKCKKIVSIKIPLIVSVMSYILFKIFESRIYLYINGLSVIKQDIITDMADF